MEHAFWHTRWMENRIGFHQEEFNAWMRHYWSTLNVSNESAVLVPLCGKSKDLLWLREAGHEVIGVELSEIACRDFFAEQNVTPEISDQGTFTLYARDGIELFCGDFFTLAPETVSRARAIYDRAALIALPPKMRAEYAKKIKELTHAGDQILLITLECDEARNGPPFAVYQEEVRALYEPDFSVERLDHANVTNGRFEGERESVYRLIRT